MKGMASNVIADDAFRLLLPSLGVLAGFIASFSIEESQVAEMLALKTVLGLWLSYTIIKLGIRRFEHKFYICIFYLLFNTLYLNIFPLIAVFANAHFIIYEQEMLGYVQLFDISVISNIVFSGVYYGVLHFNKSIARKSAGLKYQKPIIYMSALSILGGIAALWLTQTASMQEVYGYEDIAPVFTGKGWVLRASEMLAVSGLLFLCLSNRQWDKFMLMGIAFLLAFTLFRVQFLNRENVIKYALITAIYYIYTTKTVLNNKQIVGMTITIAALLLVIPYFAILRVQLTNQSTTINYWDTFSRDLNFGEVAAVLYENENMRGVLGLKDGLSNIAAQLLPRGLYEEKPLSLGVQITAITTLVPFYNENAPAYSYAPTMLGSFYYITGSWLAMIYVVILAVCSAVVAVWMDNEKQAELKKLKMVAGAVFIYHIIISSIKLEPGNALPAAIVPCLSAYLATTSFMSKIVNR